MTTNQVLVRAKEYLLNYGWRQGSVGTESGPVCLLGATGYACGMRAPIYGPADEVLRAIVGVEDANSLADWNDTPGRTLGEVIAALDAAILKTAPPRPDESPFTALEDLPAEQYLDALSALALIPAEAIGA